MNAVDEIHIPAPELRGAIWDLGACRDLEVGLDGPAGCVAGETRIYNPVTNEHASIKELCEKGIAPIVQTLIGARQAEVPFKKGVADLFRVTLASGRQCVVTGNHLVLTPTGWRYVSSLAVGDLVGVGEPSAQPSCVHSSKHISANSLSHCLSGTHQYDAQLPHEKDSALSAAPPRDDVRIHGLSYSHMGDPVYELSHTLLPNNHHANMDYSHQTAYMAYAQTHGGLERLSLAYESYQLGVQSQRQTRLVMLAHEQDQCCRSMHLNESYLTQSLQPLEHSGLDLVRTRACPQFYEYSMSHDRSPEPFDDRALSNVYISSMLSPVSYNQTHVSYNNTSMDEVSSIEYERTDEYFDLHVPVAEHYLAEGIWHHNTGKTFGILYYIHTLLLTYPGSKWLITRMYNTDLAGSAMATYRDDVIHPSERIQYFGGNKVEPASYRYPNGSRLLVSGLDRASKVKSLEVDGVYINEATECDVDRVEFCRMRLRKGKMPFQQLLMDFNPDAPTHHLNVRMNEGITTRLLSRHEDNPRYWDARANDWTEEGRRYVLGTLEGLTGVRKARYRHGLWVAAEGTVYEDSWDPKRSIIDPFPIPASWPRYMSLDFGYVNPFCAKWYAEEPDGGLICYREIYKTKVLVEDHCKEIRRVSRWGENGGDPLPRAVIADHDAEDRATFERHAGLTTMPAHKSVSDGIQAMQARLRPSGSSKARLRYFRNCLVERDKELVKAKKPTCTVEEYDSYIWDERQGMRRGEQPVKEGDHGLDSDRYMVAYKDLKPSKVKYSSRVY